MRALFNALVSTTFFTLTSAIFFLGLAFLIMAGAHANLLTIEIGEALVSLFVIWLSVLVFRRALATERSYLQPVRVERDETQAPDRNG